MDPGEAHVSILGEHHDRRSAQRDLEALLGFGEFLGARLDPLFELLTRLLELLKRAQMRRDLGLKPIARGTPQEFWREPPDDDRRRQRKQCAQGLQHSYQAVYRPKQR